MNASSVVVIAKRRPPSGLVFELLPDLSDLLSKTIVTPDLILEVCDLVVLASQGSLCVG